MSDMPATSFIDEHFQSQHAAKCDLLVRITGSSYSYAAVDQVQDQIKILHCSKIVNSPIETLKNDFSINPIFGYTFRKVKVSIETDRFTFIPEEAYDEERQGAYAMFNTPDAVSKPRLSHIRAAGIKNISAMNSELIDTITGKFEDVLVVTQAEPLIEAALKYYFKPAAVQTFIQFNGETFELLFTEGKKVLFYNVFPNSTADEFNYFLLFSTSQLGIDCRNVPAFLTGEIVSDDDRYQRVMKYFTNVQFADSRKMVRIPEAAGEISSHSFFSLLSLNLCV